MNGDDLIATPCPRCQGIIMHWWFDSDCRGNDSSSGYQCRECGASWDKLKHIKTEIEHRRRDLD